MIVVKDSNFEHSKYFSIASLVLFISINMRHIGSEGETFSGLILSNSTTESPYPTLFQRYSQFIISLSLDLIQLIIHFQTSS